MTRCRNNAYISPMIKLILLYVMAAFYGYAGINHFRNPKLYMALMPPYIPYHQFFVDFSGVAEFVLAVGLLFPATRTIAAWGIIVLLLAVFPANYYMAVGERFAGLSPWLRWGRLPLQVVLILWAWWYTR